jgi:SAM-dependent methyltransferase
VLDLGCAHGWLTAKLHHVGGDVVGIDGSAALIATARATYPELEFQVHDLTGGLPTSPAAYDRIVSHMVLMDLPDLAPMLADVATALAPTGVFVFSILHPCFFGQPPVKDPVTGQWERRVRGYLDHEERWIESFGGHTHYHRPCPGTSINWPTTGSRSRGYTRHRRCPATPDQPTNGTSMNAGSLRSPP